MDATRDPVKKVESIQYTMLGKARMASSNSGDCWYFAYGSNLDPDQKEARTGRIREARKARVVGYQLAFNKLGRDGTGKANIVPDKTSEVWGVVYRCDPAGLQRMDHSEGIAGGHYQRTRIFVQAESGEKLEAISRRRTSYGRHFCPPANTLSGSSEVPDTTSFQRTTFGR
jgi:gamma-glutamylcyclotransferase (GGCT)/AIG2-like uncharacterized protein YtfP